MYLIDTDVISELRKGARAHSGVRKFLARADELEQPIYLSVITIGELRRGIELLRYRRDARQATRLEHWLKTLLEEFEQQILEFGQEEAQAWGKLRVPYHENAIDKQIAAIALTHNLILVTRNTAHFANLGVELLNPFELK
jgi:predicted nucleic acid-binding protein